MVGLESPLDEGSRSSESTILTPNKTEIPNIKRLKESEQTKDGLIQQSKLSDAVLPEVIVTSNQRREDRDDKPKDEYELVNHF